MIERIRVGTIPRRFQFVLDALVLACSFLYAYLLRFDFEIPARDLFRATEQLPLVLAVQIATLALAGVYSFIWRYVGLRELKAFVLAFGWSSVALLAMRYALPATLGDFGRAALRHPHEQLPRFLRGPRDAAPQAHPLRGLRTAAPAAARERRPEGPDSLHRGRRVRARRGARGRGARRHGPRRAGLPRRRRRRSRAWSSTGSPFSGRRGTSDRSSGRSASSRSSSRSRRSSVRRSSG